MYKTIKVNKSSNSLKIDKAIGIYLPNLSRRMIRRALDSGSVYVNKKLERFASALVFSGDVIEIKEHALKEEKKKDLVKISEPFIIYEDDFILAINKPPFVLSQKTKNPKSLDAKTFLLRYLEEKNQKPNYDLILCHRLDKETSGVLVFAKTKEACDFIMLQFKERHCKKTYEALCSGKPTEKNWTQKDHLSTLKNKEQKVKIVNSGGKTAITEFTLLKKSSSQKTSLILCEPLTGRTHQLRVQLAKKDLCILGDKKYGPEEMTKNKSAKIYEHHLLHAKSLKIKPHKNSEMIEIKAPYPPLFIEIKKAL